MIKNGSLQSVLSSGVIVNSKPHSDPFPRERVGSGIDTLKKIFSH